MPLVPGPFRAAGVENVATAPGVYDFTNDAIGLQGDLGAIGTGWDFMITDLENFSLEPADVGLGFDLIGMLSDVGTVSAALPLSYQGDIDDGWITSQGMLVDALNFAPPQAWSDPGAAFTIPDSALTLAVPSVDQSVYAPAPNVTVGATTEGRFPALGLFNITRYGTQNFSVGDQFEVVALGPAGAEVTVDASLNGEALPTSDRGAIDGSTQFFLTGTMGPESIGVWNQKWYIDGQIMANFNFIVTDA